MGRQRVQSQSKREKGMKDEKTSQDTRILEEIAYSLKHPDVLWRPLCGEIVFIRMELFQLFLLELGEKTLVGSARERGVCGPSFGDSRAVAGPSTVGCGKRRSSLEMMGDEY